jgi:calcineurin-like phosphoesterase family protein
MATWFTADTHFGHGGALGLYRRPFASVAEMDEQMIARWNGIVAANDEVWHLGDFAVRQTSGRVTDILRRLNGAKHLVTGNNDDAAVVNDPGWSSVQPYVETCVDGVHLVLCHYAFRTWRGMNKGWLNLHGHSHGRLRPLPRQVDVGVDHWEFRPISLADCRRNRVTQAADRARDRD